MKKRRWHNLMKMLLLPAVTVIAVCGSMQMSVPAESTEETAASSVEEAPAPEDVNPGRLAIGISVYNTEDAEVQAFRRYFKEYLGPAFDADFYYSDSILQTEEELAFIDQLHEGNVPGLISFLSTDLDTVLERCDSYGMYYMRGSGSVSDEDFEKAAEHESFLGIIGPDTDMEHSAGADMAAYFAEKKGGEPAAYLIVAGGGSLGNEMHAVRTEGMLEQLQKTAGLEPAEGTDFSEAARSAEVTEFSSADGSVSVTVLPGYLRDETLENLSSILDGKPYDVVMCSLSVNPVMDILAAYEKAGGRDLQIGTVDSFTEQNLDWFLHKDPFGNPALNYVVGKYGAAVGPAFAAMFNACSGHEDFLKQDGKPFRLAQPFWVASDAERYEELYDKSINIYDNIYSAEDLRSVILLFNPEASFDDFRALTEKDWLAE